MQRRFLFIMDPVQSISPEKDTTFVFMLESLSRGHSVYTCGLEGLFVNNDRPCARARRTEVMRAVPHWSLLEARIEALAWFDAIFVRKDPPFDQSYLYSTQILSLVDPTTTFILNNPRALRDANEKLYALNFPSCIPRTTVSSDVAQLKQCLLELGGQMIIKPLDGCGGSGVFLLTTKDRNTNALLDLATDNGRQLVIAQEYIPAVRKGDKRIILLDGIPLGSVLRVPRDDDHRGNIHVGGNVKPTDLTERDTAIINSVAPRLRADGLYFVGLDVIGDYLTEVNVTSPTGLQEISTLTGSQPQRAVIDFVEANCSSSRPPS